MWSHGIDSAEYDGLLDSIERAIPGDTIYE